VVNVLYFKRSGSWGLSELEAAAQQLATVWVNDIMPHLSGEVSLRRIQARGERVQDDVSFEFVLGYRARIRNHGHSCFLCEIVIRSQFHTTYEPEA
jgi:hypothetical protein